MSDRPSLLLVDGSSYLFRAYHAMPPLTNAQGEPTGAVLGVVNMLRRILEQDRPDKVAIVFDAPGKTFRHDMYAAYKANRPPMDEELRSQIAPLHEIVRALGFPLVMESGVEADDVIGTLAKAGEAAGMQVVISTGDKDMAQLVNEHITLVNTMNDTVMDSAAVKEKFFVEPAKIIDYLALVGDTVDNVPGVYKCGPKTAAKWLNEYGTLEALIENADKIKGKVGGNLRDALEQLPLSKQLTTIKVDLALAIQPEELSISECDVDALHTWFTRFELNSLIAWLGANTGATAPEADAAPSEIATDYRTITSLTDLQDCLSALRDAEIIAFDTETTSLNYMQAELVGVSFSAESGVAYYVPCGHDYEDAPEQIDRDALLKAITPLLEAATPLKVGQNLKYDQSVLARYGVSLRGVAHDTMLQSYILDSAANRHDMDTLANVHLGRKTVSFEEIAGKGKKQLTFNQIPLEQAAHYAAEDADITLQLHQTLWPKLDALAAPSKLYREIELPLLGVLSRLERNGVCVDADLLHQQSSELAAEMAATEQRAHDAAGETFNLASPKQIQVILFEKMGLPVLRKTPKGQPSTAEDVLEQLAEEYDLPQTILRHRSLSKLKSTYTDKLPLMIDTNTDRVHTSYHQAVASTGRLSSSDPNLQNIPIRTAEGRRIRQAFVAPQGHKLVAADYSQIELRIMAHLSLDEGLLNAFASGQDVHRATAERCSTWLPSK